EHAAGHAGVERLAVARQGSGVARQRAGNGVELVSLAVDHRLIRLVVDEASEDLVEKSQDLVAPALKGVALGAGGDDLAESPVVFVCCDERVICSSDWGSDSRCSHAWKS
ncbi:MAG: hypothetical protein ACK56I_00325, partial [bacterium]